MTTKIALNPLSVQEQKSKPYATESALRTDKTILIHLRYNFSKEDLIDQCLELYNLTYSSCHVVLNEDFYVYLSFSFKLNFDHDVLLNLIWYLVRMTDSSVQYR
jgi:hypothetical protein